jgi:hypothetical protein
MLFGCVEEEIIPPPENLIAQEPMVEVLTDICKVEARFQRRLGTRGNNNSELVYHNYNVIFASHNIALSQFKSSYEYYQESPQKMQELYDSVIVHLTKEQTVLEEKEPEVPKMK